MSDSIADSLLAGECGDPRACRASGCGLDHSWAHVQPHYTSAALDKAQEEAMAFSESLTKSWNLKVGSVNLMQSAQVLPMACCELHVLAALSVQSAPGLVCVIKF